MRRDKIQTEIVKEEKITEGGCEYRYTLLCRRSMKVISYRLPLYYIDMSFKGEDGTYTEFTSGELFTDVGKALVFFRRLVDNLATPSNMPYILEDELV